MSQQLTLKELGSVVVSWTSVRSVLHVPGVEGGAAVTSDTGDLVWVATDDQRILLYSAVDPERGTEMGRLVLPAAVVTMVYHHAHVWAGLSNGTVSVFRRGVTGVWDSVANTTILLGSDPVSALVPSGQQSVYASCGRRVMMMDNAGIIVRSFTVTSDLETNIGHMSVAGLGLWVCHQHSSIISLYHTESFIHMRDIDVASNVNRVLTARDTVSPGKRSVSVTALSASKGLLWIGTNVGMALTIPLPRLEGVPIVSGKANISYHAHFGPVRMFLTLSTSVTSPETSAPAPVSRRPSAVMTSDHKTIEEEPSQESSDSSADLRQLRKQVSDGHLMHGPGPSSLSKQYSSPMLTTRRTREPSRDHSSTAVRRSSKTLPRGFSLSQVMIPKLCKFAKKKEYFIRKGFLSVFQASLLSFASYIVQYSLISINNDCCQAMADGGDSVYGLYGDLLNVRDYECDSTDLGRACQENHR